MDTPGKNSRSAIPTAAVPMNAPRDADITIVTTINPDPMIDAIRQAAELVCMISKRDEGGSHRLRGQDRWQRRYAPVPVVFIDTWTMNTEHYEREE